MATPNITTTLLKDRPNVEDGTGGDRTLSLGKGSVQGKCLLKCLDNCAHPFGNVKIVSFLSLFNMIINLLIFYCS